MVTGGIVQATDDLVAARQDRVRIEFARDGLCGAYFRDVADAAAACAVSSWAG